jgi:hypothetical protein
MTINQNGSMKTPVTFFDSNNPNIMQLANIAQTNCMMKDIVDWNKIRKTSLGEKYFELTAPILAVELMRKIPIMGQIKDSYNKIYALISQNGFQLPV